VFEHYSQSEVSLICSIIEFLAVSILQSVPAIAGFFLQSAIWFAKAINLVFACLFPLKVNSVDGANIK
jgi:hypothetical protein